MFDPTKPLARYFSFPLIPAGLWAGLVMGVILGLTSGWHLANLMVFEPKQKLIVEPLLPNKTSAEVEALLASSALTFQKTLRDPRYQQPQLPEPEDASQVVIVIPPTPSALVDRSLEPQVVAPPVAMDDSAVVVATATENAVASEPTPSALVRQSQGTDAATVAVATPQRIGQPKAYAVQVGAFQDKGGAEGERDFWVAQGYAATLIQSPGERGSVWRVNLGQFGNSARANRFSGRLSRRFAAKQFLVTPMP